MELKIYWTEFAEKELQKIFKYYKEKASYKVSRKIIGGIHNETLKLKNQPKIGQVEELLIQRKEEFRYLVFKNYKIIYWINNNENKIEINDVFDTRQNPIKITKKK